MLTGELSRTQRIGVALRALGSSTVQVPRAALGTRGRSDRPLTPIPAGELCREADKLARQTLSEAVYLHSRRCWEWACAFADIDGLRPDNEALFVACILHDLRLGDESRKHPTIGCFATAGGVDAKEFCLRHGHGQLGERVATAISHHFDPVSHHAHEAKALHDAAHLDVAGYRLGDMSKPHVHRVLTEFPRHGFRTEFLRLMAIEGRLRPRSMAATLRRAGLALPLRVNPLDRVTR